jgi:hypothetical protein
MTHLEQNTVHPMVPESTNNIEEVQIDIAPPKVAHPAQYIDKSGLQFDFEHPPENNPQVEDTTKLLTSQVDKFEETKKVSAQQSNIAESKLAESQTRSANEVTSNVLHQSASMSGGVKRYTLGQSITDYRPVVISEQGSQDCSAIKTIIQETRTIYAHNARSENTNQISESTVAKTITETNGQRRLNYQDQPLTQDDIRNAKDHKFTNSDLINQSSNFQSNTNVFRKETNQQLPVYISTANSGIRYQQNGTQSFTSQINAFPSQVNNTTSTAKYRQIGTDGRVLISNVSPGVNSSTNAIRYGSVNESTRNIVGDSRVNVNQYSISNNNNLFQDIEKNVSTQCRSYQTIPTSYIGNSPSHVPVQLTQTRVINQNPTQIIQSNRVLTSTIQTPEQAYDVIEGEDGTRRYVMRKTNSQAYLSNISSGAQNQAFTSQTNSMTPQVRYSTNYSVQPQLISNSFGNAQQITNEFRPQFTESESQAKYAKVLSSGQKNVQETQTSILQSNTYTANNFRPSSTFVNAIIPGFNGQTR